MRDPRKTESPVRGRALGNGASSEWKKYSGDKSFVVSTAAIVKSSGLYFHLLSLEGLLASSLWSGCLVLWPAWFDAMREMLRVAEVAR